MRCRAPTAAADRVFLRNISARSRDLEVGCGRQVGAGSLRVRAWKKCESRTCRAAAIEVVAQPSDSPAMGARDLGDEVADVESFEKARDAGAEGAL